MIKSADDFDTLVTRYANLLMMDLSHRADRRLELRESQALPVLQGVAPPPFRHLSNRFKHMAGLELTPCANEAQGNIPVVIYGLGFLVTVTFDDAGLDPSVKIVMTPVEGKPGTDRPTPA